MAMRRSVSPFRSCGTPKEPRLVEEYLLDKVRNLCGLGDIIMVESLAGKGDCILLHHLQHICIFYRCPFLHHGSQLSQRRGYLPQEL